MKQRTKFYKDVIWLEPFFKLAKGLTPIHKVRIVRGFSIPLDKVEQINAQCIKDEFNNYTITLRTYNQILKANLNGTFTAIRHRRRYIYDILGDFAHELAHLKEWEHTPKHWELECKINRRFIAELKKRGIKTTTIRKVLQND